MCIAIMANMFRTDEYLDNLLMCTVYGCIQKFISTMYNPKQLCTDPFRNSSVQSVQDRKVIWSTGTIHCTPHARDSGNITTEDQGLGEEKNTQKCFITGQVL